MTERRTNGETDGQTGVPTMAKAALAYHCAATPIALASVRQGRLRGGEWTQLASKLGSGGENYTLKGEEFIQFLFSKSETLDSFRCETKMRQNAPNPIPISIFPEVTP